MKKYNLSEIMKRAWEIRKETGKTMSYALTQAWAEAKEKDGDGEEKIKKEEYTLEVIDGYKGYKISWEELQKKLYDRFPALDENDPHFYQTWHGKKWEKGDKSRTYLTVNQYRKRQFRNGYDLGYYDNVNGIYYVTSYYHNYYDVIAGEFVKD